MDTLFQYSARLIADVDTKFKRYLYDEIDWNNRLIAITGSRGVGKTTMLKQYAKENLDYANGKVLYVSLDHIWFATHRLFDLADDFVKHNGEVLILDEVHKYSTWSQEIKNIYDYLPSLRVIFTGSSLLKIAKGEGDLSRRVAEYHLRGMSFREYMMLEHGKKLPVLSIEDILNNHVQIALNISEGYHPQNDFTDYLQHGYYPFYQEDRILFHQRLLATINTILEVDLMAVEKIEISTVERMRKLLAIIAESVPFVPNITELSRLTNTTRLAILKYLTHLNNANLVMLLPKDASGLRQMEKPEKIFLGNTNYAYAFGGIKTDMGNLRETFFFTMLSQGHDVVASPITDFLVDSKYSFEVGGKNKKKKQIDGLADAFVVKDGIEIGVRNTIPLWLFGLLY